MVNDQKSILIFGGSDYQLSLVMECKRMNLYTVVIDPNPEAMAQSFADAFVVVGGQDYEGTCAAIETYKIDAIITAATDKPLVMMARVAKKFGLNFFSEETAKLATDKFLMKEKFLENDLPCAKGRLIKDIPEDFSFPIVIKPRDNSGSRGVIFCENQEMAATVLKESKSHTRQEYVVAEEVIEGKEYSIESLHFQGQSRIVQITEKIKTPRPYFIELGHIQPADLDQRILDKISALMDKVATIFGFDNCGCHNEVIVKNDEVTLIEVSPRIGGDFISSSLAVASTGINMERALIQIVLGEEPDFSGALTAASGIFFFHLPEGKVTAINNLNESLNRPEVVSYTFDLELGDIVPKIRVGTDRYGYFILKSSTRAELERVKDEIFHSIKIEIE